GGRLECRVLSHALRPVPLRLLLDEDDPVRWPRHRAADVDQVALRVDLLDAQSDLRVLLRAVMARHFLALDDARWVRARSDRPGLPVPRIAVRVRTAVESVALHDTLKATALRRTHDLHDLARDEHVHLHRIADVVRRDLDLRVARLVEPEAAQDPRGVIKPGLLRVANLRPGRAAPARRARSRVLARRPLLLEAELHGRETGARLVRHGEHRIRLGRDDGARHLLAVLVEDLGHAQFSTDYANHESLSDARC